MPRDCSTLSIKSWRNNPKTKDRQSGYLIIRFRNLYQILIASRYTLMNNLHQNIGYTGNLTFPDHGQFHKKAVQNIRIL